MHWAFVDYENVGSLEDIRLEQYERLYVFCGPKNSKLKLGDLPAEGFCRIELIGLKTSGRNNLDFHLTFYLGRYHEAAEKQVVFHVISNDAGFDGVVEHLQKLGREAQRVGTRHPKAKVDGKRDTKAENKEPAAKPARQPRAKAAPKAKAESKQEPRHTSTRPESKAAQRPAPKTDPAPLAGLSDAAKLLMTQLKQTGETQRPSKKGKLLNWMQNRLQGPHAGVAPDAVLQELIAGAHVTLSGANVKYLF